MCVGVSLCAQIRNDGKRRTDENLKRQHRKWNKLIFYFSHWYWFIQLVHSVAHRKPTNTIPIYIMSVYLHCVWIHWIEQLRNKLKLKKKIEIQTFCATRRIERNGNASWQVAVRYNNIEWALPFDDGTNGTINKRINKWMKGKKEKERAKKTKQVEREKRAPSKRSNNALRLH